MSIEDYEEIVELRNKTDSSKDQTEKSLYAERFICLLFHLEQEEKKPFSQIMSDFIKKFDAT